VNENDAYIFDVENPGSWVFTGEPVWISGWFLTKTGAIFSDIRTIIAGVPHMGILGMPRPEIEKQYRGTTGLPHAGSSHQTLSSCSQELDNTHIKGGISRLAPLRLAT